MISHGPNWSGKKENLLQSNSENEDMSVYMLLKMKIVLPEMLIRKDSTQKTLKLGVVRNHPMRLSVFLQVIFFLVDLVYGRLMIEC